MKNDYTYALAGVLVSLASLVFLTGFGLIQFLILITMGLGIIGVQLYKQYNKGKPDRKYRKR